MLLGNVRMWVHSLRSFNRHSFIPQAAFSSSSLLHSIHFTHILTAQQEKLHHQNKWSTPSISFRRSVDAIRTLLFHLFFQWQLHALFASTRTTPWMHRWFIYSVSVAPLALCTASIFIGIVYFFSALSFPIHDYWTSWNTNCPLTRKEIQKWK